MKGSSRLLRLVNVGEGGAAEGGGKPVGVAPCFRLILASVRRFYVKDYKELKDARVVKLFQLLE